MSRCYSHGIPSAPLSHHSGILSPLVLHKHCLLLLLGFFVRGHAHVRPEEKALGERGRKKEENADEIELGEDHGSREETEKEVKLLKLAHSEDC